MDATITRSARSSFSGRRGFRFLTFAIAIAGLLASGSMAQAPKPAWTWYDVDANKNVTINLHLFWSRLCPHCTVALQFTDWLKQRHPWVRVYAYEISGDPANRALYQQMAASLNRVAGQTPAFFYCQTLDLGYFSYEQTGRRIEQGMQRWYDALQKHYKPPPSKDGAAVRMLTLMQLPGDPPLPDIAPPPEAISVPGLGEVEASTVSLPIFTLVIAGCDAFNPCAFFVLLLLLSLLVHGHSRARMLLVGGIFVFFSALVYFLFMAAWLNVFFVVGHLAAITAVAGGLAVVFGLINLKDFFWFKQGPSLSIPDSAKPDLYRRMNRLLTAGSLPSLIGGAAALAAVSNLYELLCTSGFPMVYTRVLTLRDLPAATYYGYLVLYNLIYVAPMALIVVGFAWTLGGWKLTEYAGRVLKLLSGVMMLVLGGVLLLVPEMLNSAVGAVAMLALSGGITGVIVVAERWIRRPVRPKRLATTEVHLHLVASAQESGRYD